MLVKKLEHHWWVVGSSNDGSVRPRSLQSPTSSWATWHCVVSDCADESQQWLADSQY